MNDTREGTLVRLENNGAWARLKKVAGTGWQGLTVLVAVELPEDEQKQLSAATAR